VPRKPTILARQARERLVEMAAAADSSQCLQTLAVLSKDLNLHASTIFRILKDMAVEGVVWQSPSGRFYSAAARAEQVRGKPLCFIGREMCHWSRLYQEILSGVSEACSANSGSFVLCSAPSLLRQGDSLEPPEFASLEIQRRELDAILKNAPRGCCGFLFDHLWAPEVIEEAPFTGGAKLQLLRSAPVGIDQKHGARLVRGLIDRSNFAGVILVVPFRGDAVIDHAIDLLETELAEKKPSLMDFSEAMRQADKLCGKGFLFVCPEDYVARALAEKIAPLHQVGAVFPLIATQGTGILSAPISRLRYDFRRLGRTAASALLNGSSAPLLKPALVSATAVL
jgi:hypothetical protein